jgi:hypothetical protein
VDLDKADKLGTSDAEFNDFTTWFIRDLGNNPDPSERIHEKIALRLMALNFAAIHTSTFTATNILFDLFSTPPEASYVEELRQEIEQVLAENYGKWNKNALAKLVKVDSAIRESLRISTFTSHGMDRLVVDPKGVTMRDGLHMLMGTRIETATHSIHHDNSVYETAQMYDPFGSRGRGRMPWRLIGRIMEMGMLRDLMMACIRKNWRRCWNRRTCPRSRHRRPFCLLAMEGMLVLDGYSPSLR